MHDLHNSISKTFLAKQQACYQSPSYCCRSLSMSQMNNHNSNLITSPKSQTVKKVQALLSKRKQRLRHGQTIVEGPRMVFDLLDNPKTAHLVRQILISAHDYELRDDYRSRLFGEGGGEQSPPHDVLVQLVHPEIFLDCTDTISPQGIVAIVDIPEASSLLSDISDQTNEKQRGSVVDTPEKVPMYLILDGVSDPGNLGTLLRTSLAVGLAGVLLLPDCCDPWNPKAVRSAMGASFQVPILESKSWEECLEKLRRSAGVERVYAATMIEEEDDKNNDSVPCASLPYFDVDWTHGPLALVIGSEGNGLSPLVRRDLVARKPRPRSENDADATDDVVVAATHIPMVTGIDSLNAAVCGSVILFEYARQCIRPS